MSLSYDCGGRGHGPDVSEVQWCRTCSPAFGTNLEQAANHALQDYLRDDEAALHESMFELWFALEQISGRGDGLPKGVSRSSEPEPKGSDSKAPADDRHFSPRPEIADLCWCGHPRDKHWPGAVDKPCVATDPLDDKYLTVCMCSGYDRRGAGCPPHRPASYISTIVFGDGNSDWHRQFSEVCRVTYDTHYHQPRFIYYGGWACDLCNAFIRPMTTEELKEEVEL